MKSITLKQLQNALNRMSQMQEEEIEGYHEKIAELVPGFDPYAPQDENTSDAQVVAPAAAILFILARESAAPGDSGNPLSDIANWITASGSKKFNVQLGCHFEEVGEMIDELFGVNDAADEALANTYDAVVALATQLKRGDVEAYVAEVNRHDFLDAVCDQIVTGTGAATMLNMQVAEGIRRVNESNWSKFVNGKPIFDDYGKIAKGPDYVKADLKGLT